VDQPQRVQFALSNADPAAKFTDSTNRTFVAPTDDSLRAAMALATPDAKTNTWTIPYDTLRGAQGASAYPGTLPVYLSVPTTGLPAEDAARLAKFIRFAAGEGQTPGSGNGQLPPGDLPMTAANGLGSLASYALRAADAVAEQKGRIPLVTGGDAASPSSGASPTAVDRRGWHRDPPRVARRRPAYPRPVRARAHRPRRAPVRRHPRARPA
jgi:hypothetical protein